MATKKELKRRLAELEELIYAQKCLDDLFNRCNAERAIPDPRGDYYSDGCTRHTSCRRYTAEQKAARLREAGVG